MQTEISANSESEAKNIVRNRVNFIDIQEQKVKGMFGDDFDNVFNSLFSKKFDKFKDGYNS
jgi:hypothetical protein